MKGVRDACQYLLSFLIMIAVSISDLAIISTMSPFMISSAIMLVTLLVSCHHTDGRCTMPMHIGTPMCEVVVAPWP